jgi:hypothetical protein
MSRVKQISSVSELVSRKANGEPMLNMDELEEDDCESRLSKEVIADGR